MFYDISGRMKPSSSWTHVHQIFSTFPNRVNVWWYRWEFLRRNPEFRADYKELIDSFGPWLKCKGPRIGPYTDQENWTKSDKEYFHAKIEPVVIELFQK